MTDRAILVLAIVLVACDAPTATSTPAPAPSNAPTPRASASSTPAPQPSAAAPRPSASAPSGPLTAAEGDALVKQADTCLDDPSCTDDAESAYRRADDAHAKSVSCFRFYYGIGLKKDLPRARACFERQVAADKCEGSSPDLDRLYLAAMRIDGQGGPAEPKSADGIFKGCFRDVSMTGLLDEIPKRAKPDPKRAPLDFCENVGGTTMTMGGCLGVQHDRIVGDRVRMERALFAKLGADVVPLEVAARTAWSAFADKEGSLRGDAFRGGTMQSNAAMIHENDLEKHRVETMSHFADYHPALSDHPGKAEHELAAAYRGACGGDADRKKVCAEAKKAWTTYRDAEVALYVRGHASLPDVDVSRDTKTVLTQAYAADLVEIAKP